MPAFHYRRMIAFAETDMAGIVHFARFFQFMEEAEHAFLRSLGLSVFQKWDGEILTWPRVSATCDYKSPARFEEDLDVAVRVTKVGRKAVTYGFEMVVGERAVATGEIVAVCCRMPEGGMEAVEIPEEVRERLGRIANDK